MSPEVPPEVLDALDRVVDPCSIATGVPINVREMGLVRSVELSGGHASVRLVLTSPFCWQATNILEAVERAVGEVDGITDVTCEIDPAADWMPDMMADDARARLRRARPFTPVRDRQSRSRGRGHDDAEATDVRRAR